MTWTRAGLALLAAAAIAAVALSGGTESDPRTPAALSGEPPPFLGTAVAGGGELTAAVDAYGDVVDLRLGPAGAALIENPADRQAAGSVDAATGIVPRVRLDGGPALPLWRADLVRQRYLPGTNVVETAARFGAVEVTVTVAAGDEDLAVDVDVEAPPRVAVRTSFDVAAEREGWTLCLERCMPAIEAAAAADRRWLARARPLGERAPIWARSLYQRSLLTLRALSDRASGASVAGARDGWAYVWPRDAATAALALLGAGYRREARRIVDFLSRSDLGAAARFHGDGAPVAGRGPQGDAEGWFRVAAAALGLDAGRIENRGSRPDNGEGGPGGSWPDYREGEAGVFLGNRIAQLGGYASPDDAARAASIREAFATPAGLVREAGDPGSGLDSAAAWAVRPFPLPALYPEARRTLSALLAAGGRHGITPGESWPGVDPWTAPTAWSAWAFAALANSPSSPDPGADRRGALRLLDALRRAATPAGALPERVGFSSGIARSTTPLAWSHAFAILALRELWPKS